MKSDMEDMFVGGLCRSPETSLMTALGLNGEKLGRGPRMLLGALTAEHIAQVMGDEWLAWEVRRVLKRKYGKAYSPDEDFSQPNPFPNRHWGAQRDAIFQVITHPDL